VLSMAFLKRANRFHKKTFEAYRFPLNQVKQSKAMLINDHTYTLIGQQSEKNSPCITNFVVVDELGEFVDLSIAEEIYLISTMVTFVETMHPLRAIFPKQLKIAKGNQEADSYSMGMVSERTVEAWNNLQKSMKVLRKKSTWTEEDIAFFQDDFTSFWKLYEERVTLLLLVENEKKAKKLSKADQLIDKEASLLSSFFKIEKLGLEMEPLDLSESIRGLAKNSLANERETIISSKADKQSHRILVWSFYLIVLGIITPFFIYRTTIDGYEHVFFLCMFYAIYVALYMTNSYRLKATVNLRLADLWQEDKSGKNKPIYQVTSSSVNMLSSVHYVTLASFGVFALHFYNENFVLDGISKFFIVFTIISLAFSICFPYSPFVEKILSFYPDRIRAGHRVFPPADLHQISFDNDYICYYFYLSYTNEPYQIYIEEDDRKKVRQVMEEWCKANQMPLKFFDKKDWKKFKSGFF